MRRRFGSRDTGCKVGVTILGVRGNSKSNSSAGSGEIYFNSPILAIWVRQRTATRLPTCSNLGARSGGVRRIPVRNLEWPGTL